MLPSHLHRLTFSALVKPVFDQNGLSSRIFKRNIDKEDVGKFVLGMWFILLIVLGCGYKSKFTSVVVLPEFTRPPTTFRELAGSHYTPFAIVWVNNLENNFQALNTEYSRKLVDTVREYNYFDADVSRFEKTRLNLSHLPSGK